MRHVGPGFAPHPVDRIGVELAELRRLLGAQEAARLHSERAPLLGRRIVEERVRLRTQDLLRQRRRARELAAQDVDLSRLDALEQPDEALDVHRTRQAIGERLRHERMIRNLAVAARQILGARELVREHGRQQIFRVRALELRGRASCRCGNAEPRARSLASQRQ